MELSQLELIDQGVEVWNGWRKENPNVAPDLSEAYLGKANLREADLSGANLREADLSEAALTKAKLSGAILGRAYLGKANLREADLSGANLREVDLSEADLRKANLSGANLSRADLGKADLGGADLSEADLRGADLREAGLARARLRVAKLSGAILRGADLGEADLNVANLRGADLTMANLGGADLTMADLGGANLNEADLRWTNLAVANLSMANLNRAKLFETIFGDTQLRGARGLDACIHAGPSTVDHRTLAKSGPLPLAFLRGCGLPDKLVEYLPTLLNEAIQFYSCFISYSTKNETFAQRLHADLQNKGVRCWYSPEDIAGGKKLHEQIDEAIRVYDRLLLILSDESMKSEWVKTEIAKARKREIRENRRMLFPVRLVKFETLRDWECFDSDTGKDSAREIREYFIPDFSNWKDHDSYQKAFERLLKDLKAETNPEKAS